MKEVKVIVIMGNGVAAYSDIKKKFDAIREKYPSATWISKATIGIGLMAAKYAILNHIPLFLYIPSPSKIMTKDSLVGWRHVLSDVMKHATGFSVIPDTSDSDKHIINQADVVITFYSHTDNREDIQYAKSAGKPIVDGYSLDSEPAPSPPDRFVYKIHNDT